MKYPPIQAIRPRKPDLHLVASAPLFPRWEHLPPERQHELVTTLAAMLIKRLPVHRLTQKGVVAHE